MMGGQHTTYDSITKTTTTEADGTGMMLPVVQQEEHATGGTLLEGGEVGAAAEDRRRVLVRRSMLQTRSVAAILVGAAVLLVALTTMDFGGGIGSVGSLVSVRSTSRTDTDWHMVADDYSYPGYDDTMPEDNDYGYPSGYDDGIDINDIIEEDIILTAAELEIWRSENGISAQEGECHYCDAHHCRTGMPLLPNEDPICYRGNYQCQYYTNCGNNNGGDDDDVGDESQCQICYHYGCATGRPTVSGDENTRDICKNNHCQDYANCEHDFPCSDYPNYNCAHDYPPAQGGTEVVWASWGKDSKSAKSDGVEEKTGRKRLFFPKNGKAY